MDSLFIYTISSELLHVGLKLMYGLLTNTFLSSR